MRRPDEQYWSKHHAGPHLRSLFSDAPTKSHQESTALMYISSNQMVFLI